MKFKKQLTSMLILLFIFSLACDNPLRNNKGSDKHNIIELTGILGFENKTEHSWNIPFTVPPNSKIIIAVNVSIADNTFMEPLWKFSYDEIKGDGVISIFDMMFVSIVSFDITESRYIITIAY